jgi:hypothetical protein
MPHRAGKHLAHVLIWAGAAIPGLAAACSTCRPTVAQAVYDAQFAPRLFLLVLPLVIFLGGLALVAVRSGGHAGPVAAKPGAGRRQP